ncbi:MAG: hypothetical protein KC609_14645, partial [Myxococcales bacterium]|nr:hypothetical protein [Myxococcales bacterium]
LSLRALRGSGSWELVGSGTASIVSAAPFLVLAGWIAVTARFARASATSILPTQRARGVVCVLLAFMLLNRFFSPQYLVWVVPFVGLALAPGQRFLGPMLLCGAAALGSWLWPFHYVGLLRLEMLPALVALAKNALLVALFALAWRTPRRDSVRSDERESENATTPGSARPPAVRIAIAVASFCFIVGLGALFARPSSFRHAEKGYLQLALHYYRAKRGEQAIRALLRCSRDYPQAFGCRERLALLQLERGDARGAERTMLDALRRAPNRLESWRSLAKLYRSIGAGEQFLRTLERLSRDERGKIDPSLPPVLRKLWRNGRL